MKTVTEDKIIASLAVVGMATILSLVVMATIKWVDPFLSFDFNGDPTIIGRMFVYGIYFAESLAGIIVLYLAWLAFWSFIPVRPRRRARSGHIAYLPPAPRNITGQTGLEKYINN